MDAVEARSRAREEFYEGLAEESFEEDKKHISKGIEVSDLVYKCARRAWFNHVVKPVLGSFIDAKGLFRTWRGRKLHETSLASGKKEMSIEWKGIYGRVDSYNPETKTLTDYKMTKNPPRKGVRFHHERQLKMYRVMLEGNGKEVKIIICNYVNQDRDEPDPRVILPDETDGLKSEMLEEKERLENYLELGVVPPREPLVEGKTDYWSLCGYCDWFSLCFNPRLKEIASMFTEGVPCPECGKTIDPFEGIRITE